MEAQQSQSRVFLPPSEQAVSRQAQQGIESAPLIVAKADPAFSKLEMLTLT